MKTAIVGSTALFQLGNLYLTAGVSDRIAQDVEFAKFCAQSLARHKAGDWGDLGAADKKENGFALDQYLRIFSAYENKELRTEIWLITEADRKSTTILFPEEY